MISHACINRFYISCCVLLFASFSAFADIKLPAVIGDNMVLQADKPCPIWGWTKPGQHITVNFNSQTIRTMADKNGQWMLKLAPMKPAGPFEMIITPENGEMKILKNILIGEVWVCAGQSNMQWPLVQSQNGQQDIAAANYPKIRFFKVPYIAAVKPMSDCTGRWVECTPQSVSLFSAIGYYFGLELYKKLKMPIGLIEAARGGSPAEAWTPFETLQHDDFYKPLMKDWHKRISAYNEPLEKKKYELEIKKYLKTHELLESHKQSSAQNNIQNKKKALLPKPVMPENPAYNPHCPAVFYNGMISPLLPYAIQGVIWYQGETNAPRAQQYRKLFVDLISSWREKWKQGNFPFIFVQLANFKPADDNVNPFYWAELREAQEIALTLPNTGQAVAIDLGESNNIHPRNKHDIGRRLAIIARNLAYGENIVSSGPIYKSMRVTGCKVIITFDNVYDGLMVKGTKLAGFTIAGEDKKFVSADAILDGNNVTVFSKAVPKPVAVRYAWANDPQCNLYNKNGFPALPFRTDTNKSR